MARRTRWFRALLIQAVICAVVWGVYVYGPRMSIRSILGPRDAGAEEKPYLYIVTDGKRQDANIPPESKPQKPDQPELPAEIRKELLNKALPTGQQRPTDAPR